jgi:hypothetical protein
MFKLGDFKKFKPVKQNVQQHRTRDAAFYFKT